MGYQKLFGENNDFGTSEATSAPLGHEEDPSSEGGRGAPRGAVLPVSLHHRTGQRPARREPTRAGVAPNENP